MLDQVEGGVAAALAEMTASIGKRDFGEKLLGAAGSGISHDAAALILFGRIGRPAVLADHLRPAERGHLYGDYLSGVYRLSPFYLMAQKLAEPRAARIMDIAPEGFAKSEYYRRYFAHIGVADLIGALLPVQGGQTLFLSFSRGTAQARFSTPDVRTLSAFLPVLAAAACRHGELAPFAGKRSGVRPPATPKPESHGLTQRESEVVSLILQGHSARSAAAALKISTETVRVHRRHIYEKLGISSQAGLFHWYLSAGA